MTKISEKVYVYKGQIIFKDKDKEYKTNIRIGDRYVTISSKDQNSLCEYLNDTKRGITR